MPKITCALDFERAIENQDLDIQERMRALANGGFKPDDVKKFTGSFQKSKDQDPLITPFVNAFKNDSLTGKEEVIKAVKKVADEFDYDISAAPKGKEHYELVDKILLDVEARAEGATQMEWGEFEITIDRKLNPDDLADKFFAGKTPNIRKYLGSENAGLPVFFDSKKLETPEFKKAVEQFAPAGKNFEDWLANVKAQGSNPEYGSGILSAPDLATWKKLKPYMVEGSSYIDNFIVHASSRRRERARADMLRDMFGAKWQGIMGDIAKQADNYSRPDQYWRMGSYIKELIFSEGSYNPKDPGTFIGGKVVWHLGKVYREIVRTMLPAFYSRSALYAQAEGSDMAHLLGVPGKDGWFQSELNGLKTILKTGQNYLNGTYADVDKAKLHLELEGILEAYGITSTREDDMGLGNKVSRFALTKGFALTGKRGADAAPRVLARTQILQGLEDLAAKYKGRDVGVLDLDPADRIFVELNFRAAQKAHLQAVLDEGSFAELQKKNPSAYMALKSHALASADQAAASGSVKDSTGSVAWYVRNRQKAFKCWTPAIQGTELAKGFFQKKGRAFNRRVRAENVASGGKSELNPALFTTSGLKSFGKGWIGLMGTTMLQDYISGTTPADNVREFRKELDEGVVAGSWDAFKELALKPYANKANLGFAMMTYGSLVGGYNKIQDGDHAALDAFRLGWNVFSGFAKDTLNGSYAVAEEFGINVPKWAWGYNRKTVKDPKRAGYEWGENFVPDPVLLELGLIATGDFTNAKSKDMLRRAEKQGEGQDLFTNPAFKQ